MSKSQSNESSGLGVYKILLADDHAIVRKGLRQLIDDMPHLSVVAEAGDGLEVLDIINTVECDMVILDISMPKLDGLKALSEIKRIAASIQKNIRIIILSMHKEKVFIDQSVALGANAYILKSDVFDNLVYAIDQVRQGNKYFSQDLVPMLLSKVHDGGSQNHVEQLTTREKQVLELIAAGHTNSSIARLFGLSTRTVEKHRANLMAKLGLKNLSDLIKFAIDHDLI